MRNNLLTAHYMLIVLQVAMHMLPFQIFTRAPVLLSAWPLPIQLRPHLTPTVAWCRGPHNVAHAGHFARPDLSFT